eukprot:COSAG06_NODE_41184_length_394_cov_0.657627_1_plen_48_part_10
MAAAESGDVENPLAPEGDAESPPNAGAESEQVATVTYKQSDIKAGLND